MNIIIIMSQKIKLTIFAVLVFFHSYAQNKVPAKPDPNFSFYAKNASPNNGLLIV